MVLDPTPALAAADQVMYRNKSTGIGKTTTLQPENRVTLWGRTAPTHSTTRGIPARVTTPSRVRGGGISKRLGAGETTSRPASVRMRTAWRQAAPRTRCGSGRGVLVSRGGVLRNGNLVGRRGGLRNVIYLPDGYEDVE